MWLRCATTWPRATTLPPRSSRPQDARDLVVLTVGNAYLLVLADRDRGEQRRGAGGHVQDFARPGRRQSPGGHGAAARRAARARGLPVARAAVDRGAERARKRQAGAGAHHRPAAGAELQPDRQGALRGLRRAGCRCADPAGPGESQGSGGAGGSNRGSGRAAQGGHGRAPARRRGQRRLRRHRHHAGAFARHRRCDSIGDAFPSSRSSPCAAWPSRRRRSSTPRRRS